jgi:hypothetical protein
MFDRLRPPEADAGDAGGTIKGYVARLTCGQCGARVQELRRGRCWSCYQTWAGLRPVGKGARCVVCAERRSDNLRLVEIHGRSQPLCHGCAGRASRLSPLPYTVEGLRRALSRERRWEDRRLGGIDARATPHDRRHTDRRHPSPQTQAGDDLGGWVLEVDVVEEDTIDPASPVSSLPSTESAPVALSESVPEVAEPAAVGAGRAGASAGL